MDLVVALQVLRLAKANQDMHARKMVECVAEAGDAHRAEWRQGDQREDGPYDQGGKATKARPGALKLGLVGIGVRAHPP
jgi:hypothetical protein